MYHQKEAHAFDELKLKIVWMAKTVNCCHTNSPEICVKRKVERPVDEQTKTNHVFRRNIISNESPLKKICKVDGPMGNTQDVYLININVDTDCDLQELTELLPSVEKALKECGKYEDYTSFNLLIRDGKFPLDILPSCFF